MQTSKDNGKGKDNGKASEIVNPMPAITVEDQTESDPSLDESEAVSALESAAADGAPIRESVLRTVERTIMANRLKAKLASRNPNLAKYLVGPTRKSLGL